jgi:hypothetical protein
MKYWKTFRGYAASTSVRHRSLVGVTSSHDERSSPIRVYTPRRASARGALHAGREDDGYWDFEGNI